MADIKVTFVILYRDLNQVFSGIMNDENRLFICTNYSDENSWDDYCEFISVFIEDELVELIDKGKATLKEALEDKDVLVLRWNGDGDKKVMKNIEIMETKRFTDDELERFNHTFTNY